MVKSARRALKRPRADRMDDARAQTAPAETNRVVEAAIAAFAHEIRTPLTGVLAISELLAEAGLGERERGWVAVLKESAEHINALASLVIDGVRAEEKGLVLCREPFDLHAMARSAAAALVARAQAKGLACSTTIADDLPDMVIGDAVRLRAAIENLIDNAVKFTDAGEVRLDVSCIGGKVSFAVADTGIGLGQAEIRRLFKPFAQGCERIAERFGGAGLGLAFVRRVAQAMGGDVTVTSDTGHGSVFRFTVGLDPAPAREATATGPARTPGSAEPREPPCRQDRRVLHVLCAEDNAFGRIITKTILSELGHTVEFVGSGTGVVEAAKRHRYDVVLMDVILAGIDGIEATRRIRSLPGRAGQIPVIGLSGHAARENEAAARAAGMDYYLRKPVRPAALADALDLAARKG
jgi:CheY-like chemotaxis protein